MTTNIHELIGLYCYICQVYDSRLYVNVQRLSNNSCPKFTDAEVLTVYLWGLNEQLLKLKAIYSFTKKYLLDCFPQLPSYAAFAKRVAYLSTALMELSEELVTENGAFQEFENYLIDTMPVIVSQAKQRKQPRVAEGLCSLGYCPTKKLYYYGVKFSALGRKQAGAMPIPAKFGICGANEGDITLGKAMLADTFNIDVFADLGYVSQPWHDELLLQNVHLHTSTKRQRNSPPLSEEQRLESKRHSSFRQPVESFFSSMASRFDLERAHFVRSINGLLSFIWGRLSAALLRIFGWFNS
jgi:hypothetical protein